MCEPNLIAMSKLMAYVNKVLEQPRQCVDCQRDKDNCPDCYQGGKYQSPDIERDIHD